MYGPPPGINPSSYSHTSTYTLQPRPPSSTLSSYANSNPQSVVQDGDKYILKVRRPNSGTITIPSRPTSSTAHSVSAQVTTDQYPYQDQILASRNNNIPDETLTHSVSTQSLPPSNNKLHTVNSYFHSQSSATLADVYRPTDQSENTNVTKMNTQSNMVIPYADMNNDRNVIPAANTLSAANSNTNGSSTSSSSNVVIPNVLKDLPTPIPVNYSSSLESIIQARSSYRDSIKHFMAQAKLQAEVWALSLYQNGEIEDEDEDEEEEEEEEVKHETDKQSADGKTDKTDENHTQSEDVPSSETLPKTPTKVSNPTTTAPIASPSTALSSLSSSSNLAQELGSPRRADLIQSLLSWSTGWEQGIQDIEKIREKELKKSKEGSRIHPVKLTKLELQNLEKLVNDNNKENQLLLSSSAASGTDGSNTSRKALSQETKNKLSSFIRRSQVHDRRRAYDLWVKSREERFEIQRQKEEAERKYNEYLKRKELQQKKLKEKEEAEAERREQERLELEYRKRAEELDRLLREKQDEEKKQERELLLEKQQEEELAKLQREAELAREKLQKEIALREEEEKKWKETKKLEEEKEKLAVQWATQWKLQITEDLKHVEKQLEKSQQEELNDEEERLLLEKEIEQDLLQEAAEAQNKLEDDELEQQLAQEFKSQDNNHAGYQTNMNNHEDEDEDEDEDDYEKMHQQPPLPSSQSSTLGSQSARVSGSRTSRTARLAQLSQPRQPVMATPPLPIMPRMTFGNNGGPTSSTARYERALRYHGRR